MKFFEQISVAAELLHSTRQTDGHDEGNSRFSHFCECAQEMKFQFFFYVLRSQIVISKSLKTVITDA
jgi:hypothetical protein